MVCQWFSGQNHAFLPGFTLKAGCNCKTGTKITIQPDQQPSLYPQFGNELGKHYLQNLVYCDGEFFKKRESTESELYRHK